MIMRDVGCSSFFCGSFGSLYRATLVGCDLGASLNFCVGGGDDIQGPAAYNPSNPQVEHIDRLRIFSKQHGVKS